MNPATGADIHQKNAELKKQVMAAVDKHLLRKWAVEQAVKIVSGMGDNLPPPYLYKPLSIDIAEVGITKAAFIQEAPSAKIESFAVLNAKELTKFFYDFVTTAD